MFNQLFTYFRRLFLAPVNLEIPRVSRLLWLTLGFTISYTNLRPGTHFRQETYYTQTSSKNVIRFLFIRAAFTGGLAYLSPNFQAPLTKSGHQFQTTSNDFRPICSYNISRVRITLLETHLQWWHPLRPLIYSCVWPQGTGHDYHRSHDKKPHPLIKHYCKFLKWNWTNASHTTTHKTQRAELIFKQIWEFWEYAHSFDKLLDIQVVVYLIFFLHLLPCPAPNIYGDPTDSLS